MRKVISTGIALLAALFFAGCAQTYHFRVDALADPQAAGAAESFALESGFNEAPGARLRFREAADFAGRALRARGYRQVEDESEADIIVTVFASISEPLSDTERRMEPMYYRSWGRSDIIRTPVVDKAGNVAYIRTHIYTPPQTYFAGYSSYDRSVVVYRKELEMTARTQEGDEIWTVTVETVDSSSDLRSYLPYLAAAATPYLGETTEGAVGVRVKEDDDTVQYLKGMSSEPTRR